MSTPAIATVSHYRLIEPLGRGAMGEVWLAEDSQLPRRVAIKLLPRHLAEDREAVERLLREARTAASVDHPAVITIYEAGIEDGVPFLVMQRVEGETLERRLAREPMPLAEVLEIGTAIADALAEVHALGIVHRDLKPANILLGPRGPKILDFGLASARDSLSLTMPGTVFGTPLYMSPEQLRGQPCDNRADLWALGVILYEGLTGHPPFAGDGFEAVSYQILNHVPPPASAARPEVGPDLDYMVGKLLRKEPAHRYARAEDLLADLTNCVACRSQAPATPPAPALPRLAVLPFEVLSPDPSDAYLASGLAEDLIVDLTRLGGLRVASRGEVLAYRDRAVPPRTLGRELGADYVLTGSVRRAGARARINVQLVRAADGHAQWGDRYDRTIEDLFDVQAEVSKRIVEALRLELRPGDREALERPPTRSAEAYGHYLKGRALIDADDRASNLAAEDLLRRAVELDPDFAQAHAALGECYAWRGYRWWGPRHVADWAETCARRSLELDPDQFDAQFVMAMVHRLRADHQALHAALDRVIAMSPDHAEARYWLGWSYMAQGRPDLAVGILEELARQHPDYVMGLTNLEACYGMLGRDADEQRVRRLTYERLEELLRRQPDHVHGRSLFALYLARHGDTEAALREMRRSLEMAPGDGRIHYNAACTLTALGRLDEAIAQLRAGARNAPDYLADWPSRDPDLAPLRGHPEFLRLFPPGAAGA